MLRLIRRSTAHAGQDTQGKQLGGGALYEKKIKELPGHPYRP
ncbi:hypothetical protein CLOBOL_07335 [Enterocloster bolteae ATCC BAA-613]|uniref:Uncharacterized protein n=1 Tax=Enterocloster bolteae (strain ATCC BAA-613 / DSM 15670 / CCUG 46953 / JCM 12243 / WAL 16351) TaxID=411902 RepID=A8S5W0_ENTBW|nr:hypothetical protein CLOBOL_07335 [Enterocloster bolteae ATCC BAA-613]